MSQVDALASSRSSPLASSRNRLICVWPIADDSHQVAGMASSTTSTTVWRRIRRDFGSRASGADRSISKIKDRATGSYPEPSEALRKARCESRTPEHSLPP